MAIRSNALVTRKKGSRSGALRFRCAVVAISFGSYAWSDAIDDIKPGEWYEVPNSKLATVQPSPVPPGTNGTESVMLAWSGGAFDNKRDRLIIWGGGHGNYSGNEVYVFDVNTLKWSRVSDPSLNVGGDEQSGLYPDGNPRSRHTYNYVQYVPSIDRFCTFGGGAMYPTGAFGSNKNLCFDFEARKWTQMANAIATGIGSISARDPETGLIWVQASGNNGAFAQWDAAKDTWTKFSSYPKGWFEYYYTAAAGRAKFLALGMNKVIQWDLVNPQNTPIEIATTGDNQIVAVNNPGFAYQSKTGYFMAWNGGADVYALDVLAKKWLKVPLAATNKVIPTAAQQYGTYGRFQYVASRDVFIVVNRTTESVYLFRPSVLPIVSIKDGKPVPRSGKVRIEILNGTQPAFNSDIPVVGGLVTRGALSCRILSPNSGLLFAQNISESPQGSLVVRMEKGRLQGGTTTSGAYFLQILQGDQPILSRRFNVIR